MKGHTQMQWEGKFYSAGRCCFYCGVPLTLKRATKDHLVPTSRGGSDEIDNIVPACFPCNRRKGKMTAAEFSKKQPKITGVSTPSSVVPVEERNEPGLLQRLRLETDSMRPSWAWRHPVL